MADVNYPELGDGITQRWYNEGDLLPHPSGAVYQARRHPDGLLLPSGAPKLIWVLIQEPPK